MKKKSSEKDYTKEIIDDYNKKRPVYEECTQKIEVLVKNLLLEEGFNVHSITSRTKEIVSLENKLEKFGKTYEKLTDVTDLAGVRIICFFSDDVDKIADLIKDNFKINEGLSVDKREIIDPDKFGYLSLHFIVEISEDRAKLPEYRRFKG